MSLSVQFLDELRARTLLSAVIAPSVKLIRAGREYKACCPFHQEKTPSFTVNDDKGFYHCFGCGAHGDAIRFLTDARGLPFIEAVKELAGKAGMELPAADPRERERSQHGAVLREAMTAAQRWFADNLTASGGGDARDYLRQRGIDEATIGRFGLGLAPSSRSGLKHALEPFGEDRLVDAGLLIRPEGGGENYDRFRGRLMFPIRDARGAVIAFGGRILGEGEPKYLNSPETALFDKGRTLYNLDRAAVASRSAKRLLVVEGYMDVIALDQAGISEVVAPLGTALTEGQLERLWRLDPAPILCFDGDAAGQKAAIRAALRALPLIAHDRTLRLVALPAGQDPDDVVRGGGRQALEALLATAEALDQRLWRHERDTAPLATPEARAGLRQRLVDHVATIGDPALRQLYRDQWLERFESEIAPRRGPGARIPWNKRGGRFVPPPPPVGDRARSIAASGIDGPTARALVLGFTFFPEELPAHCEQLAALPITDRKTSRLRDELVDAALSGAVLDRDGLIPILNVDGAAGGTAPRAIGFSFTRRDCDPNRARSDLAAAIEIIAATGEVEKALEDATERLKRDLTDEALAEQQRLIEAQQGLKWRLASLAGTD